MPKSKRVYNGKTQYKAQYRWTDLDGNTHKSSTSWFDSKREAQLEADRLKALKTAVKDNNSNRRAHSLFNEFSALIEQNATDNSLKNKSSDITLYRRLKSLNANYFPEELKNTPLKSIGVSFFRKWLEYLNRQPIAGQTIRAYKYALQRFNKFLADRGYYSDYNTDIEVSIAIGRVDIKPRKVGSRRRTVPTVEDIEELKRYYENDLGKFRNFYYYTFFYFLFYTGLRVSEAVALQWKNVDLSPDNRIIYVVNAINEKEDRQIALERTRLGHYSTKNETSERGVVIFDIIYQLLLDYKYRYKIYYNLTDKAQEECFVFPALRNPNNYASHRHLLEELKRACEGAGIPNLDNGMFRHGCATFLVAPPPEGLGYSPEMVYSQLGHCDSEMINEIYGKLSKTQQTRKNKAVFNQIYHPEENIKEKERIEELGFIVDRIKGNNQSAEIVAKLLRFMMELENMGDKRVYYYNPKDYSLIQLLVERYPNINFVERE